MKLFNTIAIVIFLSVVGFIVYKVSTDSNRKYYETIVPKRQTIERKLHLPGNVLPIREVEVKPQLSGVLDKVYVEIGQHIRQGAPLATIRLVPNSSDVEQLENNLRIARIEYEALQLDYERNKRLFDQQTISAAEWESIEKNFRLGKEKVSICSKSTSYSPTRICLIRRVIQYGRIADRWSRHRYPPSESEHR